MKCLILIITCFVLIFPSKANEYIKAFGQTFYSQNGLYKLEIAPTKIPKGFEKELKRRVQNPEKYKGVPFEDSIKHCSAILYKKNGFWFLDLQKVWEKELVNSESPEFAFISNDGKYVLTIDDWYFKGNSNNTIVVYNHSGEKLKNYALSDFIPFPKKELKNTVISTEWFVGIENYSEKPYIIKILTHDKDFNIKAIYYDLNKLEFKK